ncbi:hypothetical protein WJX82_002040 [Trebouxia sp. C0006]
MGLNHVGYRQCEDFTWADVDWHSSSSVQKSQHQPSRYFQDLLRKFIIIERLVPELNNRYISVRVWAEKCRPDGRKSLPAYPFILHRLLLQLKEPEAAAKIKVPTGKKVQHCLNMWWSELEPRCYYLKEEDGVCQSPRPDSRIGLRSLIDLKSAHGGLYMGVHYDQSQFYFVRGTSATPVTTPKGITVNEDPKGAWASLSIPCDENILPAIQAIEDATAAG